MSSQINLVNSLNSASTSVTYYGLWTILPTCLVGNLISIIIYTRPNFNKKTNTGFLYGWLCVFNVIVAVYYFTVNRGATTLMLTINLPCGMMFYFQRTISNMISWMQVIISLDRFIAVYFPAKITFMSKKVLLFNLFFGRVFHKKKLYMCETIMVYS